MTVEGPDRCSDPADVAASASGVFALGRLRLVLDETLDEARWQATFAGSQDKLARLAERARGEIARGEIRRDDPSDLPE